MNSREPIETINFRHNRLNTDGCIHLFRGLKSIRDRKSAESKGVAGDSQWNLRHISIAGNWIGDPALPAIVDYLGGDSTLESLELQNNGFEVGDFAKRCWLRILTPSSLGARPHDRVRSSGRQCTDPQGVTAAQPPGQPGLV